LVCPPNPTLLSGYRGLNNAPGKQGHNPSGRIFPVSSIEKIVTRKRKGDEDAPWVYWLTRPVSERLAMVDEIRAEYHGWTDEPEPRLSRVCQIIRRS
jgi:hypothetical protein